MNERDLKIENLSKKDLVEILKTIVAAFPLPIDGPVIAVMISNAKIDAFNRGLASLKRLETRHKKTRRGKEKWALAKRHNDLAGRLRRLKEDIHWLRTYIDKNKTTTSTKGEPCNNS